MGYVDCNLGSAAIRWVGGGAFIGSLIGRLEGRIQRSSSAWPSAQAGWMRLGGVGARRRPTDVDLRFAVYRGYSPRPPFELVERLMEAELIFLRRQLEKLPGFVCAVVPSAKAIGHKHFSRANYYTDKALEFDEWLTAFHDFARQRVMPN